MKASAFTASSNSAGRTLVRFDMQDTSCYFDGMQKRIADWLEKISAGSMLIGL
jgi:hypothetical protein